MAKLGKTFGHVKMTATAARPYYKPALGGKVIFRYPGVLRRSTKVIGINEKLEGQRGQPTHPVTACRLEVGKQLGYTEAQLKELQYPGKYKIQIPSDKLWDCMRQKMKELLK